MVRLKKVLCLIPLFYLICGWFTAVPAAAASSEPPQIIVENTEGGPLDTVTVAIDLESNPGIASMVLSVQYDTASLTLMEATFPDELGGLSQIYKKPGQVNLAWIRASGEYSGDGTFATLTFTIHEDAAQITPITVSYDPENIFDKTLTNVNFAVKQGSVTLYRGIQASFSMGENGRIAGHIRLYGAGSEESLLLVAAVYDSSTGRQLACVVKKVSGKDAIPPLLFPEMEFPQQICWNVFVLCSGTLIPRFPAVGDTLPL